LAIAVPQCSGVQTGRTVAKMTRVLANRPNLDDVATAMLTTLNKYLPPNAPLLPPATVTVASMAEEQVGIGRLRGTPAEASAVATPKGIRLNAVTRFQIWAADPAAADVTIADLNMSVMGDRDTLRSQGFLKLALEVTPPAESHLDSVGGWRRYADYRVLYEFDYQDPADAQGLIARIPVHINDQFNESMLITDELTRWTNLAAPPLTVRGPAGIGGLTMLAFVPGPVPTAAVTLTRAFDGAQGPPQSFPNFKAFLAAVSGDSPKTKFGSFTFPNFTAFLSAFKSAGAPTALGDWDKNGVPDIYKPLALVIDPPIKLPRVTDRFSIAYKATKFDKTAVVYLRATQ
jgi:hypothetical protein